MTFTFVQIYVSAFKNLDHWSENPALIDDKKTVGGFFSGGGGRSSTFIPLSSESANPFMASYKHTYICTEDTYALLVDNWSAEQLSGPLNLPGDRCIEAFIEWVSGDTSRLFSLEKEPSRTDGILKYYVCEHTLKMTFLKLVSNPV